MSESGGPPNRASDGEETGDLFGSDSEERDDLEGSDGEETGDLFGSDDGGRRWNSPTARFGARGGVALFGVVLAALFVLPDHPLVLVPGDGSLVGVREDVGNGAFVAIAVASACAGGGVGVGYPLLGGDVTGSYRAELVWGVFGPTGVVGLVASLAAVVVPAVALLVDGDPLGAALFVGLLAQTALFGFSIFGSVYLFLPAALGVVAGTLLASLASRVAR